MQILVVSAFIVMLALGGWLLINYTLVTTTYYRPEGSDYTTESVLVLIDNRKASIVAVIRDRFDSTRVDIPGRRKCKCPRFQGRQHLGKMLNGWAWELSNSSGMRIIMKRQMRDNIARAAANEVQLQITADRMRASVS